MLQTPYAIQLTPFQCVLGYQPSLLLWNDNPTDSPAVDDWFRCSEKVWEDTHYHLEQVAQTYKTFADQRCINNPQYHPGDQIWLATQDL